MKPAVLKTVWPERVTGVRIPPPPPLNLKQFGSYRDLASTSSERLRRFFIPVLSQRFQKPLGSTSTNKATVCETVVSAIGDYFRVARQPFLTSTRGPPTLSLAIQGESEQYVTRHTAKARVAGIYEEHAIDVHGARAIKVLGRCRPLRGLAD